MSAAAPREAARRMTHAGVGLFALSLRWLPWWSAVVACAAGIAMNSLVLPRTSPQIFRPGERGITGVRAYPVAVLMLVLLFPMRVAAGAWAVLAVGDAVAALVGRAIGTVKLPWNRDKSLQGMLAFLVLGSAAGAAAFAFVAGRPDPNFGLFSEVSGFLRGLRGDASAAVAPPALGAGAVAVAALASGAVGAVVETLPSRIDDNIRVALAAGVVWYLLDPLVAAASH
jgi:dolichol kinase